MQEELKSELLKSLEVVKDYLGKTAEFASEQAPIVVDELVRFNLVYNGLWLILSVLLLATWYWMILLVQKGKVKDDDTRGMMIVGGFFASALPAGIIIMGTTKDFIMCLTAPRLFVIEYLADLIK